MVEEVSEDSLGPCNTHLADSLGPCNTHLVPRIILHHSSVPFSASKVPEGPPITEEEVRQALKAGAGGGRGRVGELHQPAL